MLVTLTCRTDLRHPCIIKGELLMNMRPGQLITSKPLGSVIFKIWFHPHQSHCLNYKKKILYPNFRTFEMESSTQSEISFHPFPSLGSWQAAAVPKKRSLEDVLGRQIWCWVVGVRSCQQNWVTGEGGESFKYVYCIYTYIYIYLEWMYGWMCYKTHLQMETSRRWGEFCHCKVPGMVFVCWKVLTEWFWSTRLQLPTYPCQLDVGLCKGAKEEIP